MPKNHDSTMDKADILIVDDESANLKLLSEILVKEGYRVRPANSPKLAIDSALGKPPDLILLDIRMPDMDGFEVCASLKQDDRTRDIPILFISALQNIQDKVRAFEAGGVDFITKPFQEEEVLARVQTHLKLRTMQRNLEEMVAERTSELAKSEQLARSLLNATTDLTHLIDEDGTILDLNDAVTAKTGRTREELIGTCVFDLFPPETAEARRKVFRKALEEGKPIRVTDRHSPGKVFDTGVYPIETPAGEKGRVVIHAHDITELEQSQQALIQANRKMRLAAESAQFGIWDLDVKKNQLEWDDWMFRLYGVSPDHFSGSYEDWLTGVHSDDRERCRQEVEQALSGEKAFDSEFRVVHPDGQVRYIKAYAAVSRDSQGNPVQMTGINYDITRERRAENSLQQKVKQMRTILDTTPSYIFAKDIDGRFLLANKAAADVFGVDPEKVFGKTDLDYGATEEQTRAYNLVDRGVIESQESLIIPEEQIMRKDGTLGWFQTTKVPYQHPGYDKPAILGVAVEITERRQAEQELQKSRDYLEHLLNSIPDAVFSVKLPDRTIEWARDSYNVLGHNLDEFIGKKTDRLYSSAEEYQAIGNLMATAIREKKDAFITEVQVRKKNGDSIPAEVNTTIYREKGAPAKAISLVRDISFRKKAREALEASEALLKHAQVEAMNLRLEMAHLNRIMTMNELAASFAHELNQPLGAISNNATVARMQNSHTSEGTDEFDEILEDIVSDAQRAGQIIRKIRDIMKKRDAVYTSVDINQLLDEVIALYRNSFSLEHVLVDIKKEPGLLPVKGDHIRLQQVMMNLITNATDAMEYSPRKRLMFRTFQSGGMVTVSISDTGTGIEKRVIDQIFDPFYTTKSEGMGIGLRLCKSIIEEHGGRIWAESSRDAGTTFYFTLKIFSGGGHGELT